MDWVFEASSPWYFDESNVMDDISIIGENQSMAGFEVDQGSCVFGNEEKRLSKKPRGHANEQHASCLVDGCIADLSGCREYHRRHRVCETHAKTAVVTIGGKDQRFCQQCSRFQPLGEFDDVKRSCRKRLDGHNRRRRKPRAESMYLKYGTYLANHQGTKLLRFGGSPAYMTTFGGPLAWPVKEMFNQQQLHVTVEQTTPSNPYARFCSTRDIKFPFLLETDSNRVNLPSYKSSFQQVFSSNASSHHLLVEPTGALSLLSKHTSHHEHHASESHPINLVQPFGAPLRFNGSFNQHLDPPNFPSRNVTGSNNDHANNHLIGTIHFRTEGLLENETAEVLSYSWE